MVVDLFCGTGRLSNILLKNGFEIIGIDKSIHMINIAKKRNHDFIKNGKAQFILGDAEKFTTDQSVGFVVATFDSINHLPDEQTLGNCFDAIYACLELDGYLLFDINTQKKE